MARQKTTDGIIPVLLPNTIIGENSSVHPSALREGEFPLLQNLRIKSQIAKVRGASKKLTANPPASGADFRGAWSGRLNGNHYTVAAYQIGSYIRIFHLNSSTWAWTELTASSGYFGVNYLSSSVYDCDFCKVPVSRDSKRDVLLIYAGSAGYPFVWDPAEGNASLQMSKMLPISLPGSSDAYKSVQSFPVYWDIQSGTWTFTSLDSDLVASYNSTAPNRSIKVNMLASADAGDWCRIDFGSGLTRDLSNCKQLILRVNESASGGFWGQIKVEISEDGTNYFTVGDPADITLSPVTVNDPSISGVTWYGYSLDSVASANRNAVRYIRFTSAAGAVSSSTVYALVGVFAGSGNIQGLADWCVAFRNRYSGAESPRQYLAIGALTPVSSLGGGRFGSSSGVERIPNSSLLYYTYANAVPNPNSGATITDLGNYPTTADFYIRYSGSDYYGWFDDAAVYTASGGNWVGTAGATLSATFGSAAYTGMDETIYPPDTTHGYIPRPICMMYTGSRVLMGGDYAQPAELYVGEHGYPFRWRPTARFLSPTDIDPLSATRNTFPNAIRGFALTNGTVQGSEYGVPVMLVWTEKELYRLFGLDCESLSRPTFVGPHGLQNSRCWTRYETSVYWLDDERQIRRLTPDGLLPISRGKLDERLRAGQVSSSSAVFFRDRLYVSFADPGDADNMRLAVWDEQPTDRQIGLWSSDYYRYGIEQLMDWDNGTYQKLLAFGGSGLVYQLECGTEEDDDDGQPIIVKIRTRMYQESMWEAFFISKIGIVADDCGTGSYADFVCSYMPDGEARWSQVDGRQLSLDAGTKDVVWRVTGDDPITGDEDIEGLACQIEMTANMAAHKQIYSIRAWSEGRESAEDAS